MCTETGTFGISKSNAGVQSDPQLCGTIDSDQQLTEK